MRMVEGVLLGTLGMAGIPVLLWERFRHGQSMQVFQDGYGQYETWASYAGGLIGSLLILATGWVVRWWVLWRRSRQEGITMKALGQELKRGMRE